MKNTEVKNLSTKFREELKTENQRHRKELEELNNWYLKTLKDREDNFSLELGKLQDEINQKEADYLREVKQLRD